MTAHQIAYIAAVAALAQHALTLDTVRRMIEQSAACNGTCPSCCKHRQIP